MRTYEEWTSLYKAVGLLQGICDLRLLWSKFLEIGIKLPDLGTAMNGETSSLMFGQLPSEERWKKIGIAVCNDPNADANTLIYRIFEVRNLK